MAGFGRCQGQSNTELFRTDPQAVGVLVLLLVLHQTPGPIGDFQSFGGWLGRARGATVDTHTRAMGYGVWGAVKETAEDEAV